MTGVCNLVGHMDNQEKIIWLNNEEKERLANAGFCSFADFWNLEDKEQVDSEVCREHSDRSSGDIVRRTVKLKIDGEIYFLKRTQGKYFQCVLNEAEAAKVLPSFNLQTAEMAAYSFDYQENKGFILLKNLEGYVCVQELVRKNASPEQLQCFADNIKQHLTRLVKAFLEVRKGQYYYPDWRDKHIFFNFKSDSVALIDLERFVHVSKLPWYYRIGPVMASKRKKEKKTFVKSLKSDLLTEQAILGVFDKQEKMV